METFKKTFKKAFGKAVVGAAGAMLALSAAAQPSTVKEPAVSADGKTIRLQVYPGAIINLMQWVMVDRGFCAAHKLSCELVSIPSAPLGLQALVAGSLDVVISSADVVAQAIIGGAPVQYVGGLLPAPPFALSMRSDVGAVNRTAPYPENVKSIRGMKIGVTARGAGPEVQMRLLLAEAGMDPDKDVVYVAVGSPSAQYAALAAKQIDGVMGFEPLPTICDSSSLCSNLVDLRKGQGPVIGRGGSAVTYVAARSLIQNNPAVVDAFRQASAEAIEWSSKPENFPQVMTIVRKYFTLGNLPDAEAVTERLVRNQVASYHWVLNRDGMKAYVANLTTDKPGAPNLGSMIYQKAY